jgi:glc operon protein GlcG
MLTLKTLGEAEARLALDACTDALRARGKVAAIAVSDAHGELIAAWRMDGAPLAAVGIASNKAYTSARLRGFSGEIGRAVLSEGGDMHYHGDARYVGWDGGVPVLIDGACVGAVAVSGLSGVEDLEFAQAGATAILKGL